MVTGKSHKPTRFARFVLYPLAGVFFCIILAVVLTLANGYRFTYTGGKVGLIKTGMLIVTSRPFDASITLNGKLSKYRTGFYLLATKISALKPGDYFVELKKAGYRTWHDTLEIKPNMVTWANYILLFAEKLNITKVEVPVGNVVGKSDNGRHLLFANTSGVFTLKSLDTNNLAVRDFWPAVVPVQPWLTSPKIISAEYSPSSDLALLHVTNGARNEWVVSDASVSPAKLIHLNNTLGQDVENAWWNIGSNNEVYVQTKSGISLVGVNATSISTPIVKGAISFHVDDSRQIIYAIKNDNGTYSVERMNLDGGNKTTFVASVVTASSYKFAYSPQTNILAVLNNDTGDLTAYYVGNSSKKTSVLLSTGVTSLGWSKNGECLYYSGKDFVKRYDWIKEKETIALLPSAPSSLSFYFDEYHYLVTTATGIYEMDYDGSNVVPMSESPVSAYALDTGNHNIIFANKDAAGLTTYYKFISEF